MVDVPRTLEPSATENRGDVASKLSGFFTPLFQLYTKSINIIGLLSMEHFLLWLNKLFAYERARASPITRHAAPITCVDPRLEIQCVRPAT